MPNGHYNHIDLINKLDIKAVEGIFWWWKNSYWNYVYFRKKNNPYVLAGSIRDDECLWI